MRRIASWLMGTVTAVVLLFGYHTSTAAVSAAPDPAVDPTTDPVTEQRASSPAGAAAAAGGGNSSGSSTRAAPTTRTVTGRAVSTPYGPIQVAITVDGGRFTDVNVLQHPDSDFRDRQINGYALPILISSSLDAQSANIDMVSGATYTSQGYLRSLQAALDEAGL